MTTLSNGQNKARLLIKEWFSESEKQTFYLGGYAGTGKTTVAKDIIADFKHSGIRVRVMAPTGKAAEVLRRKGLEATTIHKALYSAQPHHVPRLQEIDQELEALRAAVGEGEYTEAQEKAKHDLIAEYNAVLKAESDPSFSLSDNMNLHEVDLIVIDEASMVTKDIYRDLIALGKKILFIGDPGQLPPVDKFQKAMQLPCGDPDYILDEIHRQALDNPLVVMAHKVRTEGKIPFGNWGDSMHISMEKYYTEMLTEHDQIITARNITRQLLNVRARQLLNRVGVLPVVGDKLICTKNNYDLDLCNGSICFATSPGVMADETSFLMNVRKDIETVGIEEVPVYVGEFFKYVKKVIKEIPFYQRRHLNDFDFGYAITCHKSQGSEWDKVLVMHDDTSFLKDHERNWLYTAITRAKERVTIVKC